ncbi:MAG TPA: hypothetical protein VKU86_08130 [Acidimicrobiales bacterium]|nr:hypothetical protein [Acidimicrobiales bacterium]
MGGNQTLGDDRSAGPDAARRIDLRLPAQPEVLQLVRLSATFVASQADLAFEEIADLMLAIDELCSAVLGPAPAPSSSLLLHYRWDTDSIEVSCQLTGSQLTGSASDGATAAPTGEPEGVGPDAHEWAAFLSRQILGALVDEHVLDAGDRGWLRKRRVGALC